MIGFVPVSKLFRLCGDTVNGKLFTASAASSTRTHQTYLLFYIMSTLVLFGALLLNTYRILRRRIPEYAVHHLFGATQRFIFARMYLFVLGTM